MAEASAPLTLSERGKRGMRARWGPQRHLDLRRLDNLDPTLRTYILALVDVSERNAAQRSATTPVETVVAPMPEVRGGGHTDSAA